MNSSDKYYFSLFISFIYNNVLKNKFQEENKFQRAVLVKNVIEWHRINQHFGVYGIPKPMAKSFLKLLQNHKKVKIKRRGVVIL